MRYNYTYTLHGLCIFLKLKINMRCHKTISFITFTLYISWGRNMKDSMIMWDLCAMYNKSICVLQ